MFKGLFPKEGRFFDLFEQSADLLVEGAKEFKELLKDLPNIESRSRRIKALENQCDEVTHETIALLHHTFITPLDRDDIHSLISQMDDILDFIEAASERMNLYGIDQVTPESLKMADVCLQAIEQVRIAIKGLNNLKDPQGILKTCIEINRLENESDQLLREGMAKLFRQEPDTRQLIKMKEIYELLETVTDRCEDVANTIEGIVLEYS